MRVTAIPAWPQGLILPKGARSISTFRASPWKEQPRLTRKPRAAILASLNVNARRIGPGKCVNRPLGQGVNNGLFQAGHQSAHAQLAAVKIEQHIHHLLPRAMIGHLAAPIDMHHRDITGLQQMAVLARLPLGENPGMLDQPELIGCSGVTLTL